MLRQEYLEFLVNYLLPGLISESLEERDWEKYDEVQKLYKEFGIELEKLEFSKLEPI